MLASSQNGIVTFGIMRSSKDTPVHEAHRKSRDYIECNLKESWLLMHSAVVRSDDCRRHFSEAIALLAKALHAVEDSYAPAHVLRSRKTGKIEFSYYWEIRMAKSTRFAVHT